MQGCHVAFVCTDIPPFNTLDVLLPPVSLYQVEGSMCYLMMTFFATVVGQTLSLQCVHAAKTRASPCVHKHRNVTRKSHW